MESFVLSETLKVSQVALLEIYIGFQLIIQYLYLLFSVDSESPTPLTNQVFTTEGHALTLPTHLLIPPSSVRLEMHRGENLFCPIYTPPTLNGMVVGIERMSDYEYARSLVFGLGDEGVDVEDEDRVGWLEDGYCEIP